MVSLVENLTQLGLKVYEAKIYVALAGLGEASVRKIHEASGVPRPRIYDVVEQLADKGFIDIRQGSPLTYRAVRPDIVVSSLKKDLDLAAQDSIRMLETLSLDVRQMYSPIWYVRNDRTIQRHLELMLENVARELIVLCLNLDTLEKFKGTISRVAENHSVKILLPKGFAGRISGFGRSSLYKTGTLKNVFGFTIFEKVFSAPIHREGSLFKLDCILLADDRESLLIYTLDGHRMAVIISLPFITCVQSQLFTQMIARSRAIK